MESSKTYLKHALTVVAIDAHTYKASIPADHCYGATAHGGFLASLVLSAVQEHFCSVLRKYNQPHTFDAHLIFLRPTTFGDVVVDIEDVKLGAVSSTTRVTLTQNGKACVAGLVSNMNMDHERGLSLATDFRLDPEPVPAVVERLANGTEPGWADWIYPRHPNSPFKAFTHVRYFFPVQGVAHPSISDAWLTPLCKDDTFTTETLGSVVDLWHRMVENYRPDAEWGTRNVPKRALHIFQQHSVATTDEGVPKTPYAYPTLSMALEIKKLLPPEGAKWLFVRARAKQIKNGRFDAEVIILDQRMKIVAVSHQINSIVELKPDDKISQIRGKSRL